MLLIVPYAMYDALKLKIKLYFCNRLSCINCQFCAFGSARHHIKLNTSFMYTVISFMFAGIAIGYLLRKFSFMRYLSLTISVTIYLLLLFLGITVGADKQIMDNLSLLGGEALFFSIMSTLGSVLAAWAVYVIFFKKGEQDNEG